VAPDGQRFLAIKPTGDSTGEGSVDITVVLNWLEELKARMGA
jgi:hypothetical protein